MLHYALYLMHINRLTTTKALCIRRLLNFPKYNSASEMFVNLNIPSFNELLRKFVFSFKTRIIESDNSLVNGIVTSTRFIIMQRIWAIGIVI